MPLNRTRVGKRVATMLGQMPLTIENASDMRPMSRTRCSLPSAISDQIGKIVTASSAAPTRRIRGRGI